MFPRLLTLSALLFFSATGAFGQDNEVDKVIHLSNKSILTDPANLQNRQFVSTGQPDSEIIAIAADAGFTTIIDLRAASEDRGIDEEGETVATGMSYVSFPVSGSGDMTMEKAAEFDALLAEIDGPVLLHCGSGNRVGAMFALRASLNGASSEEALLIGEQAGLTRSRNVVKETLEESEP